jgi:hypothetical protein
MPIEMDPLLLAARQLANFGLSGSITHRNCADAVPDFYDCTYASVDSVQPSAIKR